MAGGNLDTDLFGEPIVERSEGRGRPEHVWTRENSNKVLLAFVLGRSVKQAAQAIGVSVPTLRKHYSSELTQREIADLRFEMTQMHRLNEAARGGNISAERELLRMIEKARLARPSAPAAKPKKDKPMGKKEAQEQSAYSAHKGTSWGELIGH